MPQIQQRDPAWLAHASPASQLFHADKKKHAADSHHEGPRRRIAHRGTEVFVAVGNELRWSDLGMLKDAGEGMGGSTITRGEGEEEGERTYKVSYTSLTITCSRC